MCECSKARRPRANPWEHIVWQDDRNAAGYLELRRTMRRASERRLDRLVRTIPLFPDVPRLMLPRREIVFMNEIHLRLELMRFGDLRGFRVAAASESQTDRNCPTARCAECEVVEGPEYRDETGAEVTAMRGSRGIENDTHYQTAYFKMYAKFAGRPSCCEARQYIRWDRVYSSWTGEAAPHPGFLPLEQSPDGWREDRDTGGKRFGYRTNPPRPDDNYLTGSVTDQANGDTYQGSDTPGSRGYKPPDLRGQWQFQLRVIDVCAGGREVKVSKVLTVTWGPA